MKKIITSTVIFTFLALTPASFMAAQEIGDGANDSRSEQTQQASEENNQTAGEEAIAAGSSEPASDINETNHEELDEEETSPVEITQGNVTQDNDVAGTETEPEKPNGPFADVRSGTKNDGSFQDVRNNGEEPNDPFANVKSNGEKPKLPKNFSDARTASGREEGDIFAIMGDLNGDMMVNTTDWMILHNNWGECPSQEPCPELGDFNRDGRINQADLNMLYNAWFIEPINLIVSKVLERCLNLDTEHDNTPHQESCLDRLGYML